MKIFIGTPTFDRRVDAEYARGLAALAKEGYELNLYFPVSSQISRSRNRCVKEFLKTDGEWLLFWDSDISVEDGFLTKMLETASTYNAKIVCGAYKIKDDSGQYVLTELKTDGSDVGVAIADNLRGVLEVREVFGGGTGLMLIHRSVFEKVADPWFSIVDLPDLAVVPEDYHFCKKAQEAGFKIYADPRFNTRHYGMHTFQHTWV